MVSKLCIFLEEEPGPCPMATLWFLDCFFFVSASPPFPDKQLIEFALWNSEKVYVAEGFFSYKQETGNMKRLWYPGGPSNTSPRSISLNLKFKFLVKSWINTTIQIVCKDLCKNEMMTEVLLCVCKQIFSIQSIFKRGHGGVQLWWQIDWIKQKLQQNDEQNLSYCPWEQDEEMLTDESAVWTIQTVLMS